VGGGLWAALRGRQPELPLPPLELRNLIGAPERERYDNPAGELVYPYLPAAAYENVLDLGSGLWAGGASADPAEAAARHLGGISLFNAISVFTHCGEDQTVHYLREAARVLSPHGYLHASWFLFDKAGFPMMQPFQNALFINAEDPSNAVIFDRAWLRHTAHEVGLTITWAQPPEIRGFHWHIVMRPHAAGASAIELPPDEAPVGSHPPPLTPKGADRLGLG
jgi:hypothetical protein